MRFLSGQLIVTQTAANHAQVAALLDKLREARSIQVMIEAKLITVPRGFLAGVKDEEGKPLGLTLTVAEPYRPERWGLSVAALSDEQLKLITAAAQAERGAAVLSAPRVLAFNGQEALVQIAEQQAYVKDVKVVEGKAEPVTGTAQSGIQLRLRGTASADRKYVTLDVGATVARLVELRPAPLPEAPLPAGAPRPQVPVMDVRQADTVVNLPDGRWLLLTGLRRQKADDAKQRIDEELIVLVRARLIARRDVPPRPAPPR